MIFILIIEQWSLKSLWKNLKTKNMHTIRIKHDADASLQL